VIAVLRVNADNSGRRVHVAPPSTEYSTRYPRMVEPPVAIGVDQYKLAEL
jgi:hypothetical protein